VRSASRRVALVLHPVRRRHRLQTTQASQLASSGTLSAGILPRAYHDAANYAMTWFAALDYSAHDCLHDRTRLCRWRTYINGRRLGVARGAPCHHAAMPVTRPGQSVAPLWHLPRWQGAGTAPRACRTCQDFAYTCLHLRPGTIGATPDARKLFLALCTRYLA
jgi:hypothetical protein